jgi:glycosyltransferase involved in cell wall biosynthesis
VVVGSAGLTHWRKASDLFLLVARDVLAQRPDVHVVWVGGDPDDPDTAVFRDDVARSGVADRFHLVAHVADPLPWYGAMDVFVLTAREDAFPLVCLEAGSMGVPIVCFDNGGMPELVDRGPESCGYVVPYPDLTTMGARIVDLVDDGELRRQLGERARVTVRQEFDVGAVAPDLWADVRRFLP